MQPIDHYQKALKTHGKGHPRLLLDEAILDHNIRTIRSLLHPTKSLRIVVKSLPIPTLIRKLMKDFSTNRLMIFHLPFLSQAIDEFPHSDILIGKPFPLAALEAFYHEHPAPPVTIHWLIDTEERLKQYLAFALKTGVTLPIQIEIDVGLCRGGLSTAKELGPLFTLIKTHPQSLRFSGFMGYDAHVVKGAPFFSVKSALKRSKERYQMFIDEARRLLPQAFLQPLIFNGGGSPTFPLHEEDSPLNEISIGSAFVKPTQFDLKTLTPLKPAALIGTPVLKCLNGSTYPFLEPLAPLLRRLWPSHRYTYFIYSGGFKAKPHWPKMSQSKLYGQSTNQEFWQSPKKTAVDDFVFFRPEQSEKVFLEFGDVMMIKSSGIEWLRTFENRLDEGRAPDFSGATQGAGTSADSKERKLEVQNNTGEIQWSSH